MSLPQPRSVHSPASISFVHGDTATHVVTLSNGDAVASQSLTALSSYETVHDWEGLPHGMPEGLGLLLLTRQLATSA